MLSILCEANKWRVNAIRLISLFIFNFPRMILDPGKAKLKCSKFPLIYFTSNVHEIDNAQARQRVYPQLLKQTDWFVSHFQANVFDILLLLLEIRWHFNEWTGQLSRRSFVALTCVVTDNGMAVASWQSSSYRRMRLNDTAFTALLWHVEVLHSTKVLSMFHWQEKKTDDWMTEITFLVILSHTLTTLR